MQLTAPVLSRWECVGEACEHVIKNLQGWEKIVTHIMQAEKSDNTRNTIASHLYSLLREPMVISHIHFIHGFVKSWWGPNFSWHKTIDPRTRQHGFLARHMPLQYFVQHRDINILKENWAANPNFKKFVDTFPQNDFYTKEVLASKFFAQVIDRHTKHFKQWKEKHIHLLLACEDPTPSRVMAAWLLGIPPLQPLEQNFYSVTHRTTINTTDLCSFLFKNMDAVTFHQKKLYNSPTSHKENILEKVSGKVRAMK